jgi:shikimate dehydrogenase
VSREFAIVGDPVERSLSPDLFRAAFAAHGLAGWSYRRVQIPAGQLEATWGELTRRFAGINVTAPHKLAARRLSTEVTQSAALCGSVNTVTFRDSGALGDSTDGPGFMAALREMRAPRPGRAVILGAGGAARAVAAALLSAGWSTHLAARDQGKAAVVCSQLGVGASPLALDGGELAPQLREADLLVNATPVGADGVSSPLPPLELDSKTVVIDLLYWPPETALLRSARSSGCLTASGLGMLVEQAALAFESWTGLPAPREQMLAAVMPVARRSAD